MSYTRKPQMLGSLTQTIVNVASTAAMAAEIMADPYYPEAMCRYSQIKAAERKQAIPACTTTAPNLAGGVGLRKVVPVLRGYAYAERHPWVKPVAVAAAIGVPVLIGYWLGKGGR